MLEITRQKGVTPTRVDRMMEWFSTALEEQKCKQKQPFQDLNIDRKDMIVQQKVTYTLPMHHFNLIFDPGSTLYLLYYHIYFCLSMGIG